MLGDHVCILSRGTLQCLQLSSGASCVHDLGYGSPEWLKGRLGSGYALTLMATEVPRVRHRISGSHPAIERLLKPISPGFLYCPASLAGIPHFCSGPLGTGHLAFGITYCESQAVHGWIEVFQSRFSLKAA